VTFEELEAVVARALPGRRVTATTRIGAERGVFSVVDRVWLDAGARPATVVVKSPDPGPNGAAATASGAYRREAFSYRRLLPATPVAAPRCHLAVESDGRATLVLEDLSDRRAVDQLDGLDPVDTAAVACQLARMHRHWAASPELEELPLRRATPAALDPDALARGRALITRRWEDTAGTAALAALDAVLERRDELVEAFATAGPATLCHGDPRADNLVFAADGQAVLFDWQQVAVQFAQADLAWLTATSMEPSARRSVETSLVAEHAAAIGHDPGEALQRYRLGMLLPGLAVLLLAQRRLESARTEALVATSLRRILTAVADLHLADLGR
jgi:hypothetical protein